MTLVGVVYQLDEGLKCIACRGPGCSIAMSGRARLDSRGGPTRPAADTRSVGSRIEDHCEVGIGEQLCG
jgi:hypothetical protein